MALIFASTDDIYEVANYCLDQLLLILIFALSSSARKSEKYFSIQYTHIEKKIIKNQKRGEWGGEK